jgi:hypothetical protein
MGHICGCVSSEQLFCRAYVTCFLGFHKIWEQVNKIWHQERWGKVTCFIYCVRKHNEEPETCFQQSWATLDKRKQQSTVRINTLKTLREALCYLKIKCIRPVSISEVQFLSSESVRSKKKPSLRIRKNENTHFGFHPGSTLANFNQLENSRLCDWVWGLTKSQKANSFLFFPTFFLDLRMSALSTDTHTHTHTHTHTQPFMWNVNPSSQRMTRHCTICFYFFFS